MLLSLTLASTPAMAAHMGGGSSHDAPGTPQLEQEEARHQSDHVDREQLDVDCQDVCCSGTCVSAHLAGESVGSLNLPRMRHSGTHADENSPARVVSLLRPPKL